MIDIAYIREHPERVKEIAQQKLVEVNIDRLLELDTARKSAQKELDDINRERNELAATARGGKPSEEQIQRGKEFKHRAADLEASLRELVEEYTKLLCQVPNVPTDDTPVGASEAENVVMRQVGEKPEFGFTPKPHWELGEALGIIDNEQAGAVAGSRFTYLKGALVWLQLALTRLALETLTSEEVLKKVADQAGLTVSPRPFIAVIPPHMIRPEIMEKMARLEPRDERYHIPSDDVYLIGSAEHTLGPLHMNETFQEADVPRRYVGISPAYRRESGSHGKDVRGILRLHQFDKIEMESFTLPEDSVKEQDFIVAIQEYLMQQLKLPYQVVLKCTADMGTPNARAIDIETWMPGQDTYRETHTSDLMTDYQARRLGTRVRRQGGMEYVHMNDATAFAMGRTLIAILENYQQEDGSVAVPEVLQPHVPFTRIEQAQ